ncbi:MAG: hypothetical protein HYY52_07090 [Candidatus Melainabacteria bacterium]|nr:hypothetical protein [Candidatus Melainabacteria bacterium]
MSNPWEINYYRNIPPFPPSFADRRSRGTFTSRGAAYNHRFYSQQLDDQFGRLMNIADFQSSIAQNMARNHYERMVNQSNFVSSLYIQPIPMQNVIGSDEWFASRPPIAYRQSYTPRVEMEQGQDIDMPRMSNPRRPRNIAWG